MNVIDAIRSRRSVKRFAPEPVGREQIERLLEAAVLAPNHRMTQPWRFLVLGPEAKAFYAAVVAERKAAKTHDAAAAEAVRRKVEQEYAAVPDMIGVAMRLDEDREVREEDYAACYMAVENICLEAVEQGLGTHLRSGASLDDGRVRTALGIALDERLAVLIQLGRPAEQPSPKPRRAAPELTTWLP
jgi:nitroreductase